MNEREMSDALVMDEHPVVKFIKWVRRHFFVRSGGRKGTAIESGIRIEF